MSLGASSWNQVVVLAGGQATRMLPLTSERPKYLLPVAGRPFAAHQLEAVARAGFDEVVLCVGHLGDQIRAFVGSGEGFGVRVRYVDEREARLGTGGALSLALEQGMLGDELLVLYGDSYLPFDLGSPLEALRAGPELDAVMAVYRNRGELEPSNVALSADRSRVTRYEKGSRDPSLDCIDYGATALRRRALEGWPERWGLDELQAKLAREGTLGAVVARERFFEIGSPEGLSALEAHLAGLVVAGGPRA